MDQATRQQELLQRGSERLNPETEENLEVQAGLPPGGYRRPCRQAGAVLLRSVFRGRARVVGLERPFGLLRLPGRC